jgi:pimeloyl-ACP methyl ester carboxylesterase
MKERLIIISDLWGKEKAEWLTNYTEILKTKFDLNFYDSCEIGNVDKSDYFQDSLHNQFVNGGIELAVNKLIEQEKNPINILAFSIGGVIAWNFGLKTDNIKSLVCISSTRLRKETRRPKGKITLYFGENDEYQPSSEWIEYMKLTFRAVPNKSHQVYTERKFSQDLSAVILKTTPQHFKNASI